MRSTKLRDGDINVFLKCQDCGTFLTSPSFPVIKLHFDKCQQTSISCSTRARPNNGDMDMECDFIDEKIEPVTFSQPFVVLQRCWANKVRSRPQPSSSCVYNGNGVEMIASQRAPRSSRLKALERLSHLARMDSTSAADRHPDDDDAQPEWSAADSDCSHAQLRLDANEAKKCGSVKMKVKGRKKGLKNYRQFSKTKCSECGKMFRSYYLSTHVKRYHGRKRVAKVEPQHGYRCPAPKCPTRCKSATLLKAHFVLHLENNPFVCTFPGCDSKSDSACHLKKHIKLHLDPIPACAKCGVSYASKSQLKKHKCEENVLKLRSGHYELVQVCSLWRLKRKGGGREGVKDEDKPWFARGKGHAHSIQQLNKHIQTLQRIDINSLIRTDPVFIEACARSPGFGQLILGHHLLSDRLSSTKTMIKSAVYKCAKCPTYFDGVWGYKEHRKTCTGATDREGDTPAAVLIGCPACGHSFTTSHLLDTHLRECHDSDDTWKCEAPSCGRYFSSAATKKLHFEKYHTEAPYHCNKCGQGFKSSVKLEQHMELHSADPKFREQKVAAPCKLCPKVLFNAASLRRHMLVIHRLTLNAPSRTKLANAKKRLAHQLSHNESESQHVSAGAEQVLRIKIEPELIIGPDPINHVHATSLRLDHVVKNETDLDQQFI